MTAWIEMIADDENAPEHVKEMYGLARTPHGTVDNVMRCQSLRPLSIKGHMTLYKSVLHNPDNVLPFWFLEVVASYVSILNKCDYSLAHHFMNARRLINDDEQSDRIYAALTESNYADIFPKKLELLLDYTRELTVNVSSINESILKPLRELGCEDGEILEVNQVVAYFNYSNRVLNGLGVTTEGDVVGYYDESSKLKT